MFEKEARDILQPPLLGEEIDPGMVLSYPDFTQIRRYYERVALRSAAFYDKQMGDG